jgi:Fur family ferric uptake transcriptional regulator
VIAEPNERFRAWLTQHGLKYTQQREIILQVFLEGAGEHLSLDELLERAKARYPAVGYATVYRTMKILAECGIASEHKFGEGQVRYERAVEGEHHDHLICATCGKILEFEDDRIERYQQEVAESHGMRVVSHRHEIYAECLRRPCPDRITPG